MKKVLVVLGFLAISLVVYQTAIACNGHEIRASDTVADIFDDVGDSPADITTTPYKDPKTGRTGDKTVVKLGDTTVSIYPNGDHNITVETLVNGKKTVDNFFGGEWSMVPDIGKVLQDVLSVNPEEDEEYSG